MLFDIHKLDWDQQLLDLFGIPSSMVPGIVPSSGLAGSADPELFNGHAYPLAGIAGDQQASLFGQQCFSPGSVKNTYGTGCFVLMNTGKVAIKSKHNLLTTIAWSIGDEVEYALEGSIFMAGSVIQWLRDKLSLIGSNEESGSIAMELDSSEGVYLVPAMSGLGAPHWDMDARGLLIGMTQSTDKRHIVRAALESIAYQTRDVLDAMLMDASDPMAEIRVDGGASRNDFLMQFQADILQKTITRSANAESTALGAAYLAGLALGYWDIESIRDHKTRGGQFHPAAIEKQVESLYDGWKKAVKRSMNWNG
jgi:glycerol kinase